MTVTEVIEKARLCGVKVREKSAEPGRFTLTKNGMANLEVFESLGAAVIRLATEGCYPVQVSTKDWADIVFPDAGKRG